MSDWIILRCAGRNTLPLADRLDRDGFGVWTPRYTERKRLPRGKGRAEATAPLMPSFVFAQAGRLDDLSQLARPENADFSVFHYFDKIPVIADHELTALREVEAEEARRHQRRRAHKVRPMDRGDVVTISEGGFAGMSGVVEHSDGRYTMVLFGRMSVKISTFLLRSGERMAA